MTALITSGTAQVMHTVMMIWRHSKFYNTPSRLVVLMREICNDLIAQVRPLQL